MSPVRRSDCLVHHKIQHLEIARNICSVPSAVGLCNEEMACVLLTVQTASLNIK